MPPYWAPARMLAWALTITLLPSFAAADGKDLVMTDLLLPLHASSDTLSHHELDIQPVFQVGSGAAGDAPVTGEHVRVNPDLVKQSNRIANPSVRPAVPIEPNSNPAHSMTLWTRMLSTQSARVVPHILVILCITFYLCCMMPGNGGGGHPANMVGRNDFTT